MTGELHSALALRPDRPRLRARGAERRGARDPDGDGRRGDRARSSSTCPTDRGARADRRPRRGGARAAAADLARRRVGRVIRTPRRLPPRPGALDGDDWVVLDFEGEPARSLPPSAGRSARRSATWPGCSARSRTRSRPAELARRRRAGEGWEERAREEFLAGYFETVDRHLCPPGRDGDGAAARRLRAREGGLRAALRAQQPARLGRDPGRGILRLLERRSAVTRRRRGGPRRASTSPTRTRRSARIRDGGVVVRAYRPEAPSVRVRPTAREPVELAPAAEPGLFEGVVEGADLPLRYELEVAYPDGNAFTAPRPVRVPADARRPRPPPRRRGPARGALRAARRARARGRRRHGHARSPSGRRTRASVSVVGDFNGWDGRLHPMRSLGSSGIWELFVPGVGPGARYKFELHGADGDAAPEGRPVAFAAEEPPQTASVVHRSELRVERRRLARGARRARPAARPMSIYEVHLGSWRRTLDGQPAGAPTASSPTSSPTTRSTWASRTSSCCR